MKKQFTLGLVALVFASSSALAIEPIKKGPGAGAAHEQLERLRKAGVVEKTGVAGKSHEATIEIARITTAKSKLGLEGNGLENLINSPLDISYEAKLEGEGAKKGQQVGTRQESVNTKKIALEVVALHEAIEAGTFKATTVQKAGVESLLKLLSFGGMVSMTDGPGVEPGSTAALTRDAIKFVKVMKDTIEMKKSDTTEEDIQSYVNLVENATKGLKAGQVYAIHDIYKRIGKDAMERNAGCLE